MANDPDDWFWTPCGGSCTPVHIVRTEPGELTGEVRRYSDSGRVFVENGGLPSGSSITGVTWGELSRGE